MSLHFFLPARTRDRRTASRLPLALLLVLLCAAGGRAAIPLAEYQTRIHQALTELDVVWAEAETETDTGAEYVERMTAAFERARRLIPMDETVEWAGGRVRVNNSWLEEEAKLYAQWTNTEQRVALLTRVWQRLLAIEERLVEIDPTEAAAAANTAKAQEKARLEAILRRDEYNDKPAEKNALARLWDRIKEWWLNLFRGGRALRPGESGWLSFIAMLLIFGAAGALLAYAVWKFAPFFARRRGRARKPERAGARVILGERLAPGQSGADILAEAEALARRGELRAAIRKGYVALLCELGDRKVITLAQHKTNHDYLRAVREKRPLLNEMQKLTASFENHWYGSAPATPEDWTAFRSGYQQTLKTEALLRDEG